MTFPLKARFIRLTAWTTEVDVVMQGLALAPMPFLSDNAKAKRPLIDVIASVKTRQTIKAAAMPRWVAACAAMEASKW